MTKYPADRLNLVADIGGTNTRVALADGPRLLGDTIEKFSNRDFADLKSVLRRYLEGQNTVDCAAACVAVAGPVRDGIARLTNLDWSIDRASLAEVTGAGRVAILNDLQAQGHALTHLEPDVLSPVRLGTAPAERATRLVVGIGTGFNAAVVLDADGMCLVPPSECGHTGLPVQSADDLALAEFIGEKHGFCAIDGVLSGRGLERIYRWQGQKSGAVATHSAAEIMRALAKNSDPVSVAAASQFVRLLGVTIGDLALVHLPFGGIYLAGGVARAFAPFLNRLNFDAAFCGKGRFSDFMNGFPVSVILDDAAALTGCASYLIGQR